MWFVWLPDGENPVRRLFLAENVDSTTIRVLYIEDSVYSWWCIDDKKTKYYSIITANSMLRYSQPSASTFLRSICPNAPGPTTG